MCTRAVYTAVYGPSTRPKTAVYTAVHGGVTCRVYGRVRTVSPRVHGSVRAVCMAVGRVHGRLHWPCTVPFFGRLHSAYSAVRRPCTRVVWAVYTAGRLIGPRTRSQMARYGRVRPVTAYGPCTRPCTRSVKTNMYTAVYATCTRPWYTTVYMAGYGRVHGPRPQRAVSARVHGRVGLSAMYTTVYMACTRPFNCGVDVCMCRTAAYTLP